MAVHVFWFSLPQRASSMPPLQLVQDGFVILSQRHHHQHLQQYTGYLMDWIQEEWKADHTSLHWKFPSRRSCNIGTKMCQKHPYAKPLKTEHISRGWVSQGTMTYNLLHASTHMIPISVFCKATTIMSICCLHLKNCVFNIKHGKIVTWFLCKLTSSRRYCSDSIAIMTKIVPLMSQLWADLYKIKSVTMIT